MTVKSKDEEFAVLIQDDPTPGRQLLTDRERKRNIIFFTVAAFFTSSANSIHFIFYSLYFMDTPGASEKLYGIVATIGSIVAITGLIAADYFNGLLGYKRVMIIAYLLIGTSFSFFIFTPDRIVWIIIAILILSFAFSLNESPSNILLTESAGEKNKGKVSSLTYFFGRFGEVVVSTLIFVLLIILQLEYDNKDRSYYYIFGAIIFVLAAAAVFIVITDSSRKKVRTDRANIIHEKVALYKEKRETGNKSDFIQGFISTFKDKWVLRVAASFVLDAFLWSIALGVHWPGLQNEAIFGEYRIYDEDISLYSLITNVAVLASMFIGRLVDKIGAKLLLFISEVCGLIWCILVVIFTYFPANEWIMYLARVSLGFSIALWIPATIALFTNVSPERKSKVYNSIAIFRSIGWLPGGFIAGFIFDAFPNNPRMGFLVPLFILMAGMAIILPVFFTMPNRPSDMKNNHNKIKGNSI
ncbi:MAG: MFS transporter [Candidatus Heimdallarchaeota archaeon]|nr:MFS transporter [Candidatus Heimdallarchaeota archaeon]